MTPRPASLNPDLPAVLAAADAVVRPSAEGSTPGARPGGRSLADRSVDGLRVGVDLGTAYTVVVAVDDAGTPVAGAYRFADVVRDGLVLDFAGATRIVRELLAQVEDAVGHPLGHAAVTIPPAVTVSDARAHRYVVESAGLECTAVVDEPTAANSVLRLRDGAVVDVGGGTTGIAVVRDGEVVATFDEPTGGTHLSLVVAGSHRIGFEEAELMKRDPANHARLLPVVRPVLEKIATIVERNLRGFDVEHVVLVGGTSAFAGIADVVASVTGIDAFVPGNPLFVTPLGVAYHDVTAAERGGGEG